MDPFKVTRKDLKDADERCSLMFSRMQETERLLKEAIAVYNMNSSPVNIANVVAAGVAAGNAITAYNQALANRRSISFYLTHPNP